MDRDAAGGGLDTFRQRIEGGRDTIELSPAVIRDDNTIYAVLDSKEGVLRGQDCRVKFQRTYSDRNGLELAMTYLL